MSPGKLFGRSGRHRDLTAPMGLQLAFKAIAPAYQGLLTGRVKADYDYDASVDRAAASGAVRSAAIVLEELEKIDDQSFASFPITIKGS